MITNMKGVWMILWPVRLRGMAADIIDIVLESLIKIEEHPR